MTLILIWKHCSKCKLIHIIEHNKLHMYSEAYGIICPFLCVLPVGLPLAPRIANESMKTPELVIICRWCALAMPLSNLCAYDIIFWESSQHQKYCHDTHPLLYKLYYISRDCEIMLE